MSALSGVVAQTLEPQTEQKARLSGWPDCVARSVYVVMLAAPVCRVYCCQAQTERCQMQLRYRSEVWDEELVVTAWRERRPHLLGKDARAV